MKVSDAGLAVRAHRKASGISQKDLASIVGLSRATLNYLESGRDIEIGAGRLFEVLEVLGIELLLGIEPDPQADAAYLDGVLKAQAVKGVKKLPRALLVEAFTTGRLPVGFEVQAEKFVDLAPDQAILAAVRVTSAANALPAKDAWKKGRALARACGSERLIWRTKDATD